MTTMPQRSHPKLGSVHNRAAEIYATWCAEGQPPMRVFCKRYNVSPQWIHTVLRKGKQHASEVHQGPTRWQVSTT